MTESSNLSRRSFVGVAGVSAASLAMAGALAGCAGGSASSSSSSSSAAKAFDATVNDAVEELNVVTLGKDIKIAAIIVAKQSGYYEDEKLTVNFQTVSGGFPEAMPALSNGSADVLPFGSIPSCTYIGQGDDLVIFGGTVTDGSECITLIENKDKYKKAEDFKGKRIGCFRMETGHMMLKSWLRENGIEDGKDVEFVLLEGAAAEVAAVENGEIDMAFVNSGYGYVAKQSGKSAVAFRPNELIGKEFPCCRQTTNRKAYEEKRSALIKFETANLRAMADIENNHDMVIKALVDYSGQPEAYVENVVYGTSEYTPAMKFEMDPCTDAVKEFYGNMIDNGDIENTDKEVIVDHLDSNIYKAALDIITKRGESADFYKKLASAYEAQNTLGI